MKTKNALCGLALAVVLQLGLLAGSAQTNKYLFSGAEMNITLPPGTYIITAYGAAGAPALKFGTFDFGGRGAEMSAEFNFPSPTDLTLLVGGQGGIGNNESYQGIIIAGGGGGGSFVVEGSTPLVVAGGGGGGAENNNSSDSIADGGNATVTPYGGYGGGNDGGIAGGGGNGGNGGGYLLYGVVAYPTFGAGGGGGFYTDGGVGNSSYGGAYGNGGSSFESGGAGVNGLNHASGGFGGGGGGYNDPNDAFGGGGGGYSGGGGGGTDGFLPYYFGAGGGGGSIIDSSAMAILAEVSGITNPGPGNPYNGEIIITAVTEPIIITTGAAFGFTNGVFGFDVIGPAGSNVVIQASTDLQTWIPLQTTLLGSGPLYFSEPQSTSNVQRFYRAQLSPAYTVGGTLTGLPAGDTVTLQDNGSDDLTLSTNGTFTFPTALPDGHAYSVTISGTSGGTPTTCTLTNGSGTISGANVTNVAVQSTYPALTGNRDEDMYNAAVWDGTANGGVPAVMLTENGGPFRVTAAGPIGSHSRNVAQIYAGWAVFTHVVGTGSCSSTTLPSGPPVIQFGTVLECGFGPYGY